LSRVPSMTNRRWRPIVTGGLAIGLVAVVGCAQAQPERELAVWAVSGSHRVGFSEDARRETDCYSHQHKQITLRAARNEVVACQLVLKAGDEAVERVSVAVGPLVGQKGQIPASAVRAYWPVPVRTGRVPLWLMTQSGVAASQTQWLDALVPLDAAQQGLALDVPSAETRVIWIDVAIAGDVAPGDYLGSVKIASNGVDVEQVRLRVHVLPFALPARPNVAVLVGLDMAMLFRHHLERDGRPYVPAGVVDGDSMAGQAKAVLDGTFRMLHRHRCSPFLIGLYPSVSLDASGRVRVGWETYDRTVSGYLDGTAFADRERVSGWPIPADASFPPPGSYGSANSPAYAAVLKEYMRQSAVHFRQKGWFDSHVVWTGPPDPAKTEPPERVKTFGSLVRNADAKLRLLTTTIPQSMAPFGWQNHRFDPAIADLVSIWSPPARFYDAATMTKRRATGRTTWMTIDRPPFSPSLAICAPRVDPRALAWQAFRYDIGGVVIPRINDWSGNPFSTAVPADRQWLIYPGKPFQIAGPIPSVRLKQLRRGLQDLEYLTLLKRLGAGTMAQTLARALFRYGGSAAYGDHFADGCQWPWVDEPELWDLARRLMADRIAQLSEGKPAGSDEQFVQSVEWRRLIDAACGVRVFCEGVRIRSSDQPDATAEAEMAFHFVVRNERPTPVTGQLRFGKLPVGWRAVTDNVPVNALAPLARARPSLVARAKTIGTNEAGAAYVPVVFDAGASGQIEIRARLTQVTARRLDQPVAVDGDLSDWPLGIRNVAGDFINVAGQDPLLAGREPTGRATQQTLVFVGFDRERLYFAFNCREEQVGKLPLASSNFVRYEGLLPSDTDLLEVLIDPTNAGTGQPIDIYHVMIRPTGASVARRGVATGSGWGTSRYWPADVRVAPARHERAWTVEVSIPLSAFGRAARASKRWAINFARYQPRLGEYSSWSGARRYFYNTRSFGNLKWP